MYCLETCKQGWSKWQIRYIFYPITCYDFCSVYEFPLNGRWRQCIAYAVYLHKMDIAGDVTTLHCTSAMNYLSRIKPKSPHSKPHLIANHTSQQTTTKQSKTWIVCIILGLCCIQRHSDLPSIIIVWNIPSDLNHYPWRPHFPPLVSSVTRRHWHGWRDMKQSGRSPKVVALFLLQTLVAIWYDFFNCMIQSKWNKTMQ